MVHDEDYYIRKINEIFNYIIKEFEKKLKNSNQVDIQPFLMNLCDKSNLFECVDRETFRTFRYYGEKRHWVSIKLPEDERHKNDLNKISDYYTSDDMGIALKTYEKFYAFLKKNL